MSHRQAKFIPAEAAPVFAALGDATRLFLLSQLIDGQAHSIVELTVGVGLTRQGVSKHLGVLEQAGMVTSERVGRESRYTIRPEGIRGARNYLDHAAKQWDEALARLKTFVENP